MPRFVTETVRVRLFATAREAAGTATLEWPVPAGGMTADALLAALAQAYPRLRPTFRAARFVRNGAYLASTAERVRPGDEFSVHPPYGGG